MTTKFPIPQNWPKLQQQLTPYWFLLPALALLGLTVFWPAVQAFLLSFTRYSYDLTQLPLWIGFGNFQRLLGDPVFWQTLRNTFVYLVGVVPVLVVLPLGLAILVNQKLRGISWFRAAYYTPVVISMVVAGIAWRWLYNENGLLNHVVRLVLPGSEGFPWLTLPTWSLFSVMAVTIWKGLGYYMVIYLAGLQAIPAELYEAAAIDGSDGLRKHWDVTIRPKRIGARPWQGRRKTDTCCGPTASFCLIAIAWPKRWRTSRRPRRAPTSSPRTWMPASHRRSR